VSPTNGIDEAQHLRIGLERRGPDTPEFVVASRPAEQRADTLVHFFAAQLTAITAPREAGGPEDLVDLAGRFSARGSEQLESTFRDEPARDASQVEENQRGVT
jgi:hypothetical protein